MHNFFRENFKHRDGVQAKTIDSILYLMHAQEGGSVCDCLSAVCLSVTRLPGTDLYIFSTDS